ncbi:MAG: hypothetical protein OXC80_06045 [Gammaproteobacteria bacterium]|nr:hypothetical protein [Gammaproteobacteria bacterium]
MIDVKRSMHWCRSARYLSFDEGDKFNSVVQLAEGIEGSADLEQDLIAFAR